MKIEGKTSYTYLRGVKQVNGKTVAIRVTVVRGKEVAWKRIRCT